MAGFSVISDVSAALLKLLREHLCPEPVQSPELIQLVSPADKNADFQLGIFLYDIAEQGEYRTGGQVRGPDSTRTFPPRPLALSYMLYLNGKAQIATGAATEQRILGRALQTLSDYALFDMSEVHSFEDESDGAAAVTLLTMGFDEKSKIWAALSVPYQVGIYFSVSPVLLSSTRSEPFVRVREANIQLNQAQKGEG